MIQVSNKYESYLLKYNIVLWNKSWFFYFVLVIIVLPKLSEIPSNLFLVSPFNPRCQFQYDVVHINRPFVLF